jgi:dTDP-glucose 4,6-dehydratase
MQNILVTGGSGFIGTNFIKLLHSKYDDLNIYNFDELDFDISKENHSELKDGRYKLIHASLLNKDALANLFSEVHFDYVVNFAAKSHVDNSIKTPEIFTTNNIIGTQNLLEQCLKKQPKLFIQISTDEVYGSLSETDPSTTEESNFQPNNPYSASKAGADCLVRSYYKTFGLPVIITRSSNNFGPYQYPEKLIPVIISKIKNGQKVPIYGKGENIRDWVFVEDNCAAIDFIRNNGKIGEVYNIPGHEEIKNIDLAKNIIKLLGKDESEIEFVADRPGHDIRYSMDGSKLEKLGFKIESNFEANLNKTIEWYVKNDKWLKVFSNV